jgi:hypothetical protein
MKAVLAIVIAMVSAVLGGMVTGSRNPHVRWPILLIGLLIGGGAAEAVSVWWVGAPATPLQPGFYGLVLGLLVGWLGGRPPRRRQGPPGPPPGGPTR